MSVRLPFEWADALTPADQAPTNSELGGRAFPFWHRVARVHLHRAGFRIPPAIKWFLVNRASAWYEGHSDAGGFAFTLPNRRPAIAINLSAVFGADQARKLSKPIPDFANYRRRWRRKAARQAAEIIREPEGESLETQHVPLFYAVILHELLHHVVPVGGELENAHGQRFFDACCIMARVVGIRPPGIFEANVWPTRSVFCEESSYRSPWLDSQLNRHGNGFFSAAACGGL